MKNKNKAILLFLLCILLGIHLNTKAQFYYKDIWNNKWVLADLENYKTQKTRDILISSIESNGMLSEGFYCQKKINKSYTEVELHTQTINSYPNYFTSYFAKDGHLLKTVDSSKELATTVIYNYNQKGNVQNISSFTKTADEDDEDINTEDHLYVYDANDLLTKMYFIKNKKDTTLLLFKTDENNNVVLEKDTKTGEIFYYYYDAKNRLTDIVHNYANDKKMIADFKFEYNNANLISQMITTEKDGAYFFSWKYNYDSNGLRIRERCFDNKGSLQGSVEYEYK